MRHDFTACSERLCFYQQFIGVFKQSSAAHYINIDVRYYTDVAVKLTMKIQLHMTCAKNMDDV